MKLPLKVAIGSGVTFLVIIVFGWVAFPKMIKSQIKKQVSLKPGSEIRGMYLKLPFALEFNVYLFNVTNVAEIQAGGSAVLEEIGPYCYEEWKEKLNVIDNETDDTLEYTPRDTFIFNQTKSGKLTGEEIITIPHPIIVGILNTVAREKPAMMNLASKAIIKIFSPETAFLTAKVNDILFDGVLINCTVTDFAAKAVCTQLKAEAEGLKFQTETEYLFSLLGPKNATEGKRTKVHRGLNDVHDLGRVVEYKYEAEMTVWPMKKCNQYRGTDGTIFPPMLQKDEGLWSFSSDLCRSLGAVYVEDTKYSGVPVSKYEMNDIGDESTSPEGKCYCPTPDTCPKKGLMDLSKCGSPVIASLPHFYETDPSVFQNIRGLHPNKENHSISILFESNTGTPVEAYKRLQFNIPITPYKKVPFMKEVPDALVPIFWIEESVALNNTYVGQLKDFFMIMTVMKIAKWVILVGSILGMGVGGFMFFKQGTQVSITPVKKVQTSDGQSKPTSVISLVHQNSFNENGLDDNNRVRREFERY